MSTQTDHFGPLAALAGVWHGTGGTDFSFHHADNQSGDTSYREEITFKPFGPVDNGSQSLYGLDYKMAAWRLGENDPFHTEVGYWLWCSTLEHVMRGFVIPRGSAILAGGEVAPDATSFTLRADADSDEYGITQNTYLLNNARCTAYELNLSVDGDTLTYDETTTLVMKEFDEPFLHTDRNVLQRVETFEIPAPA
jgi:hypothetical protein